MSGASPRISVILPTYNADQHLATCVESILGQTFTDFELLVIDDGSTDATIQTIESYADDRIRLIQRETTGITSALNRGIREAQGEYIARHDADDWSHASRFARQVEYLDAHPSVALVGTGAWLVSEEGVIDARRRVLQAPSRADLIEHNQYVHGSVLLRKSAVVAVGGYDERFETAEDYDLWLRLAAAYPIRNIDDPLYSFRIHGASLYGTQLSAMKLYHFFAVLRAQERSSAQLDATIRDEGIEAVYDHLPRDLQAAYHLETGRELLRYGNVRAGRSHCWHAARLGAGPMAGLLVVLSVAGRSTMARFARLYRHWVLNPRIEQRNAESGAP